MSDVRPTRFVDLSEWHLWPQSLRDEWVLWCRRHGVPTTRVLINEGTALLVFDDLRQIHYKTWHDDGVSYPDSKTSGVHGRAWCRDHPSGTLLGRVCLTWAKVQLEAPALPFPDVI